MLKTEPEQPPTLTLPQNMPHMAKKNQVQTKTSSLNKKKELEDQE